MKSILQATLTADRLWEISVYLTGSYVLFHPALAFSTSTAVVLGGGLLLLLFRPITSDSLALLGRSGLMFLVYALATCSWSISPGTSLQSAGFLFLGALLFYMGRPYDTQTQSRVETFGLLLACAASVLALRQWFFGFDDLRPLLNRLTGEEHEILEAAIHNRRASGPLVTHGALAALLILFIPYGFLQARIRAGFTRLFFTVATLLMLGGLCATQSVGAFACLTISSLYVMLKRQSKAVGLGVMGLGLAGVAGLILARGTHSWLLAAFGMRLTLWQEAWRLFLHHPIVGTGLGTFGQAYQAAGLPLGTGSKFAHNVLVQVLVETGIIGLLLFLRSLLSFYRRFKTPSRWEGWGMGTGLLAFALFSLLDLPFQMPELVWLFALTAGRMEFRAATPLNIPFIPPQWLDRGLLLILLVSGCWPPFRAWNFAMVAVVLWTLLAYYRLSFRQAPLWVFAGSLFLLVRAFYSPSTLGAVWFLELSGILLAFYLVLPRLDNPQKFLRLFLALGLAWGLKIWWVSFHYAAPGLGNWIHFQYSDVKDWMIFPNPKQIGIVLGMLILLILARPWNALKSLAVLGSLLTLARLRSFSGAAVLGVGLVVKYLLDFLRARAASMAPKPRPSRKKLTPEAVIYGRTPEPDPPKKPAYGWVLIAILVLGAGLLYLRAHESSSTKWERFGIWISAVKVWEKSPWIGVGPGAFSGLYHQVKTPRTLGLSRYLMDAQYAHNEFLDLLAAFGLAGFIFVFLLLWGLRRNHQDPLRRSAAVGLAAASFVDFCLHTPLIALQGVGLLAPDKVKPLVPSNAAGFLALGLTLGLFGSPVFSGILEQKAQDCIRQNQLPQALRHYEEAERLNPWDARVTAARADYIERLYLTTKDPVWERKSDEALERIAGMERTDGGMALDRAETLTRRILVEPNEEAIQKAGAAWETALKLLPYNSLAWQEEARFYAGLGDINRAFGDVQRAVKLEPNNALAWADLGYLYGQRMQKSQARWSFQRALQIHNRWKDEARIDPLERRMAVLPPELLDYLKKAVVP
ncbi:MAG TPA: O-antigen ligase family protein [bacterium]|nr:O-antigen ligase family protein [bacterium]